MNEKEDINLRIISEFRASDGQLGGPFEGVPVLLLHTVGARTGTPRVSPMEYLADNGRYVVFASNGGSDRGPAWYHNVVAHPNTRIEVDDKVLNVRATELHGHERDERFAEQARRIPGLADDQRKTSRTFPVIALTPTSSDRFAVCSERSP